MGQQRGCTAGGTARVQSHTAGPPRRPLSSGCPRVGCRHAARLPASASACVVAVACYVSPGCPLAGCFSAFACPICWDDGVETGEAVGRRCVLLHHVAHEYQTSICMPCAPHGARDHWRPRIPCATDTLAYTCSQRSADVTGEELTASSPLGGGATQGMPRTNTHKPRGTNSLPTRTQGTVLGLPHEVHVAPKPDAHFVHDTSF